MADNPFASLLSSPGKATADPSASSSFELLNTVSSQIGNEAAVSPGEKGSRVLDVLAGSLSNIKIPQTTGTKDGNAQALLQAFDKMGQTPRRAFDSPASPLDSRLPSNFEWDGIGAQPNPGGKPGFAGDAAARFGRGFSEGFTGTAKGTANLASRAGIGPSDFREGFVYRSADRLEQIVNGYLDVDPDRNDDFSSKVFHGLGNATSFLLTAFMTRGAGVAMNFAGVGARALGTATVTAQGAALNVNEVFDDAIKHNASFQSAMEASGLWAAAVGSTEAIPIGHLLNRIDKGTGGTVKRFVSSALKQGSEEAVQEAFQSFANNLIAKGFYDPQRDVFKDTGEASAVGFTVGAVYDVLINAVLSGRRSRSAGGGSSGGSNLPALIGEVIPPQPPIAGLLTGPDQPKLLAPPQPPIAGLLTGPDQPKLLAPPPPPPTPPPPAPPPPAPPPPAPPKTDEQFVREQVDLLNKADQQLRQNDPTYTGDARIGQTVGFFRYLLAAKDELARINGTADPIQRNAPQMLERAAVARENLEILAMLKNPVMPVSRPSWVFQTAPAKNAPNGTVLPIETSDQGQPILFQIGPDKQRVTVAADADGNPIPVYGSKPVYAQTVAGTEVALLKGKLSQVFQDSASNSLLTASSFDRIKSALVRAASREGQRMAEEYGDKYNPPKAPVPADPNAAPQFSLNPGAQQIEGPAPQQALPAPAATPALEPPQGKTYGEGFVMFDDSAPVDAALQASFNALLEQSGQKQFRFVASQDLGNRPDREVPATPQPKKKRNLPAGKTVDQQELNLKVEELPPEVKARVEAVATAAGQQVPAEVNREQLTQAGVSPTQLEILFRRDEPQAYQSLSKDAAQRAGEQAIGRGVQGILNAVKTSDRPAVAKILKLFRDVLGRELDELDVVDLATWAKRSDVDLSPNDAAAFLSNWLRTTADGLRKGAIALRPENDKNVRNVAHELTHFMLRMSGLDVPKLNALWDAIPANDRLKQKVARVYADFAEKGNNAILAEEYLAISVEEILVGRYANNPAGKSGIQQFVRDFFRRLVNFVREVFDEITGRNPIREFFSNINDEYGLDFIPALPTFDNAPAGLQALWKRDRAARLTDADKGFLDQIDEGPVRNKAEALLRAHRTSRNPREGWAETELDPKAPFDLSVNEETGDTAVRLQFKKVSYEFSGDLKKSRKGSPEYDRRVKKHSAALTKIWRGLEERAKQGDEEASAILAQREWYTRFYQEIATLTGGHLDIFADLLGATSPRATVDLNMRWALEILRRFSRGEFDLTIARYRKHVEKGGTAQNYSGPVVRSMTGDLYGINTFNVMNALLNLHRTTKTLAGEPKAAKMVNFTGNLSNTSQRATVDVWAARTLQRTARELKMAPFSRVPPAAETGVRGRFGKDGLAAGDFGYGQDVFDAASKEIGISAVELQPVLWFVEKDLWQRQGWADTDLENSYVDAFAKYNFERYSAGYSIYQGPGFSENAEVLTAPAGQQPDGEQPLMAEGNNVGPSLDEMTEAVAPIVSMLAADNDVFAYTVRPSIGLYGSMVEPSYNHEYTAKSSHSPFQIAAEVLRISRDTNQVDAFVAKALRDADVAYNDNARPGLTIRLKRPVPVSEVYPLMEKLRSRGVDGFTAYSDKRMGVGFVHGLRTIVVPEISVRWDPALAERLNTPDAVTDYLAERAKQLSFVAQDLKSDDNLADVLLEHWDVLVAGKEDYDNVIEQLVSGQVGQTGGASGTGGTWGRSVSASVAGRLTVLGQRAQRSTEADVRQRDRSGPEEDVPFRREDEPADAGLGQPTGQEAGSVAASIPVDRPLDGERGLEPSAETQREIYARFGQLADSDTTKSLKIYNLDALIAQPERLDGFLSGYQTKVELFSFHEDPAAGVKFRLPRLSQGYSKGNIWIYDPRVAHGSFKDETYTRAWRVTHELAHGIAERFVEQKYGASRRYGRLGRPMEAVRGIPPKQVTVRLEPLTLAQAQRAVEWEDTAFRIQRILLEQLGVEISDSQFAQEYNTNVSDALYRVLTGDFGNPGEIGFVPATTVPDLRTALQLMESYEIQQAKQQGRAPTNGVMLQTWEPVNDFDLMEAVEHARATGLASVSVARLKDGSAIELTAKPEEDEVVFRREEYPGTLTPIDVKTGAPNPANNMQRAKQAMDVVLRSPYDVTHAMWKRGIGWISFLHGKDEYSSGLKHAVRQRLNSKFSVDDTKRAVLSVLANGVPAARPYMEQGRVALRQNFTHDNWTVVVGLTNPVTAKSYAWPITAFYTGEESKPFGKAPVFITEAEARQLMQVPKLGVNDRQYADRYGDLARAIMANRLVNRIGRESGAPVTPEAAVNMKVEPAVQPASRRGRLTLNGILPPDVEDVVFRREDEAPTDYPLAYGLTDAFKQSDTQIDTRPAIEPDAADLVVFRRTMLGGGTAASASPLPAWMYRYLNQDFWNTSSYGKIIAAGRATQAARDLANLIKRSPYALGAAPGQTIREGYHGAVEAAMGRFSTPLARLLDEMTPEGRKNLARVLRGATGTTPTGHIVLTGTGVTTSQAREARRILNELYDYLRDAMLAGGAPATKIPPRLAQYFPQLWLLDGEFGKDSRNELRGQPRRVVLAKWFKAAGVFGSQADQDAQIDAMLDKMAGAGGEVSYGFSIEDALEQRLSGAMHAEFWRVLRFPGDKRVTIPVGGRNVDVELSELLDNDASRVLTSHAIRTARRAEFVRRMGYKGERFKQAIEAINAELRGRNEQPLSEGDINGIRHALQANFGHLGAAFRINQPFWAETISAARFLGDITYLSLSVFSSVPELLMPAVRVGFRGQISSLQQNLRTLFRTQKGAEMRRFAEDIGIISQSMHHAYMDSIEMNSRLWVERVRNGFFKFNLLQPLTDMQRAGATAAAVQSIARWGERAASGDINAVRYLREVGLKVDDVRLFDPEQYRTTSNEKVRAAIRQMVNETILAPNAAQRPSWHSDPRWALISHIKGYITAFNNTVLQRVGREALIHHNPMPLVMLGAYAMLSAILYDWREWVRWGDQGNPFYSRLGMAKDDIGRFLLVAAERGGLWGPIQPAVDLLLGTRIGQDPNIGAVLAPVASIAESYIKAVAKILFAEDEDQLRTGIAAATRAMPLINMLGQHREDLVTAVTGIQPAR